MQRSPATIVETDLLETAELLNRQLDALSAKAKQLKANYKIKKSGDAEIRDKQIKDIQELEAALTSLRKPIPQDNTSLTAYIQATEILLRGSLAVWILIQEEVDVTYRLINPSKQQNLFHLGGSDLHDLIIATLEPYKIDDLMRFRCLTALANLLKQTKLEPSAAASAAAAESAAVQANYAIDPTLLARIENAIVTVVGRLKPTINQLTKTVPAKTVLIEKLKNCFPEYAKRRDSSPLLFRTKMNLDRPLCAQLAASIASLMEGQQIENGDDILLGLLLYINEDASSGNLHNQLSNISNYTLDNLSPNSRITALVALSNYLETTDTRAGVIAKAKDLFAHAEIEHKKLGNLVTDTEIYNVRAKLEKQIIALGKEGAYSFIGAISIAVASALLVAPIGIATGTLSGAFLAGMEVTANETLKRNVTYIFEKYSHLLVGHPTNGFGFLVASPLVKVIYEALLAELLGISLAVGAGIIGAAVGAVLFDLIAYQGFKQISAAMKLAPVDPKFVSVFSKEVIEELLATQALASDTKEKVSAVTGISYRPS